ncbi:hypothetical protein BDN72DRAFT_901985 [Pluteus cervinus]|uniref:Uncharacterized protein n=1 Tax=Pluteus cervinus TaxID=181527 RepID=A0ACD3AE65_9AGAR|nr:hypothetical protein BDN72DRAFT_901985 [Pluteus cervinus]
MNQSHVPLATPSCSEARLSPPAAIWPVTYTPILANGTTSVPPGANSTMGQGISLCARFRRLRTLNPLASTTITRSRTVCFFPSPKLLSPRLHTSPAPPQAGRRRRRLNPRTRPSTINSQTPPPPRLSVHAANTEPIPPRQLSRLSYDLKINPKPHHSYT